MTNEEKAKEIIAQLKIRNYITPILEERIYHSLISIAEWKEKQMIENTCEWIKEMWSETDDRFKQDYTGILIKNFKNYMKRE